MVNNSNGVQISVFCLAYNHANFIESCIDSILSQETSFDFELIIHDDASTDGTSDILRNFASKDKRVRLFIEEENQYRNPSLSYLRDIFMPMSRGRYVAFCEGDDCWIDQHKLQDQFDYMESHPQCFMCCHLAQLVDGVSGEPIGQFGYGSGERLLSVDDLIEDWKIPTASTFMRKAELGRYIHSWTFDKPVGDFPRAVYFASLGDIYYSGKAQAQYRYSVPGSWTTVVNADPHKRRDVSVSWLLMLEEIDKHLGFSHHQALVSLAKDYVGHIYQVGEDPSDICPLADEAMRAFVPCDLFKVSVKRALYQLGLQLVSVGPAGSLGWRLVRIR